MSEVRPIQIDVSALREKAPAVGIDLGTTHTLIAAVREGIAQVLSGAGGERLIPSVVRFTDEGPTVGAAARAHRVSDPEHTLYSIKRFMGKGFDQVQDLLAHLPFRVVAGKEGQEMVYFRVGERRYNPIELSGLILREAKRRGEHQLGLAIEDAVITVPAYFNDSQRQATKLAGQMAGLNVLRILNEPTAAALAYGLDRKARGNVAVYDLGGGTFDISILSLSDGVFEVLATCGDTLLGGDDFDRVLAVWVAERIQERTGADPLADRRLRARLLGEAERVKQVLSSAEVETFSIKDPAAGIDFSCKIAREEFETLLAPFLGRTLASCEKAVADAGVPLASIEEVVLVGGSTRIPLVQRRVGEFFGSRARAEVDPDTVVALGAAIQAEVMTTGREDVLLLDVLPLSLGIETLGGVVEKLIHRNTTLPASASENFTTSVDGQSNIKIHVLQGERELVRDCRSLATFELTGIDPMPAGLPRVQVTFLVDANGILRVTARELRTGKEASIEVQPSSGLSDEEVERMLEDSFEHAEADIEERLAREVRVEAESVLRATTKALAHKDLDVSAAERARIETAAGLLRESLDGPADRHAVREAISSLDAATHPLAERMVNAAMAVAMGGHRIDEFSSPEEDKPLPREECHDTDLDRR